MKFIYQFICNLRELIAQSEVFAYEKYSGRYERRKGNTLKSSYFIPILQYSEPYAIVN